MLIWCLEATEMSGGVVVHLQSQSLELTEQAAYSQTAELATLRFLYILP